MTQHPASTGSTGPAFLVCWLIKGGADPVVAPGVPGVGRPGGDQHWPLLVMDLVSDQDAPGGSLLIAALQVWATNVIAFRVDLLGTRQGWPRRPYPEAAG